MIRGDCKECKLSENQKGITYICPHKCEHYEECECSKLEASYEQVKPCLVKLLYYEAQKFIKRNKHLECKECIFKDKCKAGVTNE
jgi:hypothetical protein